MVGTSLSRTQRVVACACLSPFRIIKTTELDYSTFSEERKRFEGGTFDRIRFGVKP